MLCVLLIRDTYVPKFLFHISADYVWIDFWCALCMAGFFKKKPRFLAKNGKFV